MKAMIPFEALVVFWSTVIHLWSVLGAEARASCGGWALLGCQHGCIQPEWEVLRAVVMTTVSSCGTSRPVQSCARSTK